MYPDACEDGVTIKATHETASDNGERRSEDHQFGDAQEPTLWLRGVSVRWVGLRHRALMSEAIPTSPKGDDRDVTEHTAESDVFHCPEMTGWTGNFSTHRRGRIDSGDTVSVAMRPSSATTNTSAQGRSKVERMGAGVGKPYAKSIGL